MTSAHLLRMSCEDALTENAIEVERVEIEERLSSPFSAIVHFKAVDEIEETIAELAGTMAHVTYDGAHLHGIVARVTSASREHKGAARYRAEIVPRLAMMGMARHSRVFNDRDVLDIVKVVLDENGLTESEGDLEVKVSERYDNKRELVMQYDETDLAFVSRLLEDEGIAYHFVHGDEREKLVLTDRNTSFARIGTAVHYAGHSFHVTPEHAIFTIECERQVVPSEVLLLDYDWRKPTLPLLARASIDRSGIGVNVSTREHYVDPKRGERLAGIRAEEAMLARERFRLTSNASELHAGVIFSMDGHPVHEWERALLITESRRSIANDNPDSGKLTVRGELTAIDAETRFRPTRATPKPRIDGMLYAKVDGVNNGVAPIDDQGRYRVSLTFEISETERQRAKIWVRRAQPLAGSLAGMHFPLLVQTEVLLAFVDGDPDRPVIVGAIPNAITVSPVARGNATQSIVRTSTGIRVLMDDAVRKGED